MQNSIGLNLQQSQKNLGIIFAYTYILLSFVGRQSLMDPIWQQSSLYALLGVGLLTGLFNFCKFRLTHYFIWYPLFIAYSMFSCLVALEQTAALRNLYSLFIVLGLAVSMSVLIKEKSDIRKMFICFSASGFILFIALQLTDQLIVEERLGNELFGNANSFALAIMLSLICSIWLAIYSNGYKVGVYLAITLTQYYMLFLSGGKKYVVIPLVFIGVLIMLKNQASKFRMVTVAAILLGITALLLLTIFTIPQFYDSIGYRMEAFFDALTGQTQTDSRFDAESDLLRKAMVEYGIKFFAESPILGYGPDNYQILFGAAYGIYMYSHNNYIELLVNLGLPGFVLYYSFYVFLIRRLWNIKNDSTKLRDFFLAFMISLLFLEMGVVSYFLTFIQIFIAFASLFLLLDINDNQSVNGVMHL